MGYFESLAEQGFQNNLPSRDNTPEIVQIRSCHFSAAEIYQVKIIAFSTT